MCPPPEVGPLKEAVAAVAVIEETVGVLGAPGSEVGGTWMVTECDGPAPLYTPDREALEVYFTRGEPDSVVSRTSWDPPEDPLLMRKVSDPEMLPVRVSVMSSLTLEVHST